MRTDHIFVKAAIYYILPWGLQIFNIFGFRLGIIELLNRNCPIVLNKTIVPTLDLSFGTVFVQCHLIHWWLSVQDSQFCEMIKKHSVTNARIKVRKKVPLSFIPIELS